MTSAEQCAVQDCDRPRTKSRTRCEDHAHIIDLEALRDALNDRLDGMQRALRVAAMSSDLEVRAVAREALVAHGRWPMGHDHPLCDGWDWRE